MTRVAFGLLETDDIYTTEPADTPRVVMLDGPRQEIDRLGVVDALTVVPPRAPRSGVRRRGTMDLEEWR